MKFVFKLIPWFFVALFGALFQFRVSREHEVERYNRWDEYSTA